MALNLGKIGDGEGLGPFSDLGQGTDVGPAANKFSDIISKIIGIMTIIAGVWFIFQFIIAAFGYLAAGGDPEKVKKANNQITNSIIGLVIVVAAYALISLMGKILGFEILNPQDLIKGMNLGG